MINFDDHATFIVAGPKHSHGKVRNPVSVIKFL